MELSKQAGIGVVLIIAGTVLFIPVVMPGSELPSMIGLFAAAALLTLGTYLFGTSGGGGRPV